MFMYSETTWRHNNIDKITTLKVGDLRLGRYRDFQITSTDVDVVVKDEQQISRKYYCYIFEVDIGKFWRFL